MGDRAQVKIVFSWDGKKDSSIYLYTHWRGSELDSIVRRALKRKQRWDDDEYLARIIFSEMIKNEIDGDTGYGIGTVEHDDIRKLVTINIKNQTVEVRDDYNPESCGKWSFEVFVENE